MIIIINSHYLTRELSLIKVNASHHKILMHTSCGQIEVQVGFLTCMYLKLFLTRALHTLPAEF